MGIETGIDLDKLIDTGVFISYSSPIYISVSDAQTVFKQRTEFECEPCGKS